MVGRQIERVSFLFRGMVGDVSSYLFNFYSLFLLIIIIKLFLKSRGIFVGRHLIFINYLGK